MSNITIKDIAKLCGVGISTVSRALNNHPDINPETKARIMQVIRETGFIPNDSARYLKRSETNNIALLVKGISNPFFFGMIRIMEDYIQKKDYTTILRHVGTDEDEVAVAMSLVIERRLKGIVFLGGAFTHDPKVLAKLGVPYIFSTIGYVANLTGKSVKVANIAVDDTQAACMAIDYLISLGHTRIGFIGEGIGIPSVGRLRYEGYRKALEKNHLPFDSDLVVEINEGSEHYTMPNGYKGASVLLDRCPDMTAVFCIADVIAMGACRALADRGKKIPEDVSVIGFDGIESGDYYIPRLTSVKQPVEEMSEETIRLLFGMIEEKKAPQNIIVPAKLLIRDSTAPRRNGQTAAS